MKTRKTTIETLKPMGSKYAGCGRLYDIESWRPMPKQTKVAKRTKRTSKATPISAQPPSQEDFNSARVLLRQRADALVLDLAKRYLASAASELTTVLDAMDGLAEFERMHPLGSPLVSHGAERGRAAVDRK
jgi:hypothetical protein